MENRLTLYRLIENFFYKFFDLFPWSVRWGFFKIFLNKLGNDSWIDYGVYIRYPWKVAIGQNTSINVGCVIVASIQNSDGIQVSIGNNCALAPYVKILTGSHDISFKNLPPIGKKVTIGDNVWIGSGAIILPGVNIGDGCVIEAGSVVTKNTGEYEVIAGNPAKFIKHRALDLESVYVTD